VLERTSRDFSFPVELAKRSIDSEGFPYPYRFRDDALPLWHAIHKWTTAYLSVYYTAETIGKDPYIQVGALELLQTDSVYCFLELFVSAVLVVVLYDVVD
jgi:arachidonate 15-lipoxygenase